jgi:outer membrane protein assembly factor BamB
MTVTNPRPAGYWARAAARGCLVVAAAAMLSSLPARGAADAKKPQAGANPQGGTVTGEWPQWRGPNRDEKSTETGLLKEWPKDGPPQAWKVGGLGTGYSSVAVVGDRIYTMGDDKDAGYVRALDTGGKIVWSAKVGRAGGVDYPGPRCTPTVDGDRVYALGQIGDLVCLNTADGKEIWRKHLETDFGGKHPHWGYAESPIIDGDRLICTPGGKQGTMLALSKKTGETLWQSKDWDDSADYVSPVVAEIGGRRQYIQLTQKSLAGVAAEDGAVLWKAKRRGATAVIPTPIVQDDLVFVTSGYNIGCNAFKVSNAGGSFKAEEVYANKDMANHHGGVILLDGYVYGHNYGDSGDGWVCMDLKTGNVKWKEKAGKPGEGSVGKGTILYADGHFYLRDEGKGAIALIEASSEGYKESGRFNQPERSGQNAWPHLVIANGKLYVRDQDKLFCYDVKAK